MADGTITLELYAPGHEPVQMNVASVIVPGEMGVFTVLPGHTSLLSNLTPGAVIAQQVDGQPEFYAVHGGFAEVIDDRVTVLTDLLEHGETLDKVRAEAAQEKARARIREAQEREEFSAAETALARATARLDAHGREEH
ncbi:MAG TPA: ATP synthase F1 subunit epsilon [Gammaproteobacteria bacterium]|nr:ATP synthase F1 subunit epsilon [Candidatus Hydrogenedentota bacterium]HJP36252.1 ATP synthase F1 subunit epsilon [Gammaproteobacteria bacterium]